MMTHTINNIIDLTNAPTPLRWFEFLLEPGKLREHLETPGCDPSPTQLITLFYRNIPNLDSNSSPVTNGNLSPSAVQNVELEIHIPPDSYEAKYRSKKAYALQTLAIKVASFLEWDLDIICSKLSMPVQYKLMQALSTACSATGCPDEVKKFSDIIYCHWFLRSAMTYRISTLQPQSNNTNIIYHTQLQQQQQAAESSAFASLGELFNEGSKHLENCSSELYKHIKNLDGSLSRPTIDFFDSRGNSFNNWSAVEPVESKDIIDEACYGLGRFFFFKESYRLAKESFELIKQSHERFPLLSDYINSADAILNGGSKQDDQEAEDSCFESQMSAKRKTTEKYLFDCMIQYGANQQNHDSDLRYENNTNTIVEVGHEVTGTSRGDKFMTVGDFKQAMGCFVGNLMLMTDYFRVFSKNYVDEEPYITRMIQCSISLSCFTQAVALCQMTKNLNYTIAFKQLNERICNDCCDDIYECIWNVTLLEYIINLHSKRGEIERRTKVIQLIGQLELNENNPEEILREAEHVRRGRFFRIMSNKYL